MIETLGRGTGDPTAMIRDAFVRRCRREGDRFDELIRHALAGPGKLVRPLALIASAEAVGGSVDSALPAAIAVEYLHVASLVHDDIIDGDDVRRGRPSVHARYGTADAIVTGDALLFDLFVIVAEGGLPADVVAPVVAEIARAGNDLCRGQVLESGLKHDSALEDYLEVAGLKTAALFRAACRAGALLDGGSAEQVDLLGSYGEHTGIAFQMYDDCLPYLADSSRVGKPAVSDAANLRPTWPVLLAYRDGEPKHRRLIETALSGALPPEETLRSLRVAVLASGGLGSACRSAREHAGRARARLRELPVAAAATRLAGITDRAVDRDR
ncbi:dimethylallyltranstransferase [Amycolatopsis thailandensis]|uniref:Dimethylallyltranstransferase n=1 Tax=Amycolatopsis thailandensis TaxID=589330 RepID=A0A229S4V8_9PSEU|nr:polyprenyl synthetase family protein [Amycolatopsis thailandensis]OXM53982.1 dimethylallyltranstransferase [Amycolatopsis thailandensis]